MELLLYSHQLSVSVSIRSPKSETGCAQILVHPDDALELQALCKYPRNWCRLQIALGSMCDITIKFVTRMADGPLSLKPFPVHAYRRARYSTLFPSSLCQSNGNLGISSDLTGLICVSFEKLAYQMEPLPNQKISQLNVLGK